MSNVTCEPVICEPFIMSRKYNRSWEKHPDLKDWIKPMTGDDTRAYCKYCKTDLRAHLSDLKDHANGKKHRKIAEPFSPQRAQKQPTLSACIDKAKSIKTANDVKTMELKLAAHIACHSSISTVDHLGTIVREISGKDIKLHRSKCTALINSVIGPEAQQDLLDDISSDKYSLLIDESTDIGANKQMAICARYFSKKTKSIISSFLGIVTLESGTATVMTDTLLEFINKCKLDISKCVGVGTDGANAMCGAHNSLITKLQEHNKNIIHIKCICHSLQLCASNAVKCLPRNIEFMLSETYNHFSHSTLRQLKYKELYATINVGEAPLKILQMADTRWLSIAPCINRILSQFDELKLHFELVKDTEKNYTAQLLFEMYNDPRNKLYLLFLQPVVNEVNRINKLFQLDQGNPMKLLSELINLYQFIFKKIMRPVTITSWATISEFDIYSERNHLPVPAMHFGVEFEIYVTDLGDKLSTQTVTDVKARCRDYLLELLKQLKKRLPNNVKALESFQEIDIKNVLCQSDQQRPVFSKLSFLNLYQGSLSVLETQFNKLYTIQWQNVNDIDKFWAEVADHTDAAEEHDFSELGNFMLGLLSLPFSNAAVERVFSQMKLIKTNQRNRMGQLLLENVLHIRSYMNRHRICCEQFKPTENMLLKFTNDIYGSITQGKPESEIDAVKDMDLGEINPESSRL